MSYINLLNLLFKAHREGDVYTEIIVRQMLDETEMDFAETLDRINY